MESFHLEVLLEEIRGKFDLVLEGHAALHAKIDAYRDESNVKHEFTAFQLKVLNGKIDGVAASLRAELQEFRSELNTKVDAVAVELAAHRADTEAHARYQVRE